ncbi:hypothetical protein [Aliterella atlantica]|uniref:Uncharacterized protein n=1 Tax=Aliterella atlantica CENA595 TaxID=1618023 RepID=A0A0D8ZTZ5_9CYAN|nr:hypothetical protein [Aliterella atlantica]KJH71862.1 hypothetical protein UH38_10825 [Aliterella atlantica CENA595]
MLAQFQASYPTGCLLAELLTIYQGKFIVRASIQIEGVVRATGMATSETLELAEDRARERALTVLLSAPTPAQEASEVPPTPPVVHIADVEEVSTFSDRRVENVTEESSFSNRTAIEPDFLTPTTPELEIEPPASTFTDYPEFAPTNTGDLLSLTSPEPDFTSNSVTSFSNVKPFVPRSAREEIPEPIDFTEVKTKPVISEPIDFAEVKTKPVISEPIDLSDTMAAIETTLKTLRWTAEQQRKYLKRNYSQESRDTLTPEQLFEFLGYLELFAQTSKELERLGWDNNQGKEYLMQTYSKASRQYLTYQELAEFLQHLQAQPTPR